MEKFLFHLPTRQKEEFQNLSNETGEPIAELMRRMFDYCFQERVLNELVPAMSGSLGVQK